MKEKYHKVNKQEVKKTKLKLKQALTKICERDGLRKKYFDSSDEYLTCLDVLVNRFGIDYEHPLFISVEEDFHKGIQQEEEIEKEKHIRRYERIIERAELILNGNFEGEYFPGEFSDTTLKSHTLQYVAV